MSFKAGVAKIDITPPLNVGMLMSSIEGKWTPFKAIRKPLYARVVVLTAGTQQLAIVSLDLLGLTDTSVGGWERFKRSLAEIIPNNNIIIHSTHTHSAPETLALTTLYKTPEYITWIEQVAHKIKIGIEQAVSTLRTCRVEYGFDMLEGFSLQRRIATGKGVAISHELQPIAEELFKKTPVDPRIKVIKFIAFDNRVVGSIIHCVCHPVHEMCVPAVSPDYPGELCDMLDASEDFGISLFLNGACGDINPPTVSCGNEYAAKHALAIAGTIRRIKFYSIADRCIRHISTKSVLPSRNFPGAPPPADCTARINVIRLGTLSIVLLPGEPFVQTGLDIEEASPFEHTLVAGYCENSVGYIPPLSAFEEGGYETGPGKWSYLDKEAASLLKKAIGEMLLKVANDG
ncbi:MAG TPA: neutral/alkaline non-lysosomal ceramidase N-terminal domain-containing protein [Agriterribacter sp.]|nr:neutral/alkaline non-lysosomal ceramidase N-terminal domain-containing protein [Agriterribacter sp.]